MTARDIVERLARRTPVMIDTTHLAALLAAAEIIAATDTCVAGLIRILAVDSLIVVQEQTPDGEVLLRRFRSREAAQTFFDDRIAAYDRMWDGCGCTIDYHKDG
jgi:hypothetical protein